MTETITKKLYANDLYLNYLRYNPQWYIALERHPESFTDFEKEIKVRLKLTTADKLENFSKQITFINGMIKYFNSN